MSIVAVHGPTMITGSGGAGAVTEAPQVRAVADMSNGWKFTFEATDKTRAAADYDWAFPGGTPATATDSQGPITVTYASAGSKTATLTVAAGAGPPAGGAYPITVEATGAAAGTPRLVEGDDEEEAPPEVTPSEVDDETIPEAEAVEAEYDPGDYNVDEVKTHADTLETDEDIQALIDAEVEGKNRSTLITYLESLLPYDPEAHTIPDVVQYATDNPDELDDIIEAEKAGKNRSTLLSQLEALQSA